MATPAAASLKSTCHCGAISLTANRMPELINECQCTICRRYAAAWAYYYSNEVDFQQKGKTRKYVWGDGDLEFHFCETCGCVSLSCLSCAYYNAEGYGQREMSPADKSCQTTGRLLVAHLARSRWHPRGRDQFPQHESHGAVAGGAEDPV